MYTKEDKNRPKEIMDQDLICRAYLVDGERCKERVATATATHCHIHLPGATKLYAKYKKISLKLDKIDKKETLSSGDIDKIICYYCLLHRDYIGRVKHRDCYFAPGCYDDAHIERLNILKRDMSECEVALSSIYKKQRDESTTEHCIIIDSDDEEDTVTVTQDCIVSMENEIAKMKQEEDDLIQRYIDENKKLDQYKQSIYTCMVNTYKKMLIGVGSSLNEYWSTVALNSLLIVANEINGIDKNKLEDSRSMLIHTSAFTSMIDKEFDDGIDKMLLTINHLDIKRLLNEILMNKQRYMSLLAQIVDILKNNCLSTISKKAMYYISLSSDKKYTIVDLSAPNLIKGAGDRIEEIISGDISIDQITNTIPEGHKMLNIDVHKVLSNLDDRTVNSLMSIFSGKHKK